MREKFAKATGFTKSHFPDTKTHPLSSSKLRHSTTSWNAGPSLRDYGSKRLNRSSDQQVRASPKAAGKCYGHALVIELTETLLLSYLNPTWMFLTFCLEPAHLGYALKSISLETEILQLLTTVIGIVPVIASNRSSENQVNRLNMKRYYAVFLKLAFDHNLLTRLGEN